MADNLFRNFYQPCALMDKRRVSDGEGGWLTEWFESIPFNAAVVRDSSITARVAESEGMASVYTVTTDTNVKLEFHDAFKTLDDGRTFRVTSVPVDKTTPEVASFEFEQVQAELWELPR